MIMELKAYLLALGINPSRTIKSLKAIPWYLGQKIRFSLSSKLISDWPLATYPTLLDHSDQSASLGEYFWQDLLVAREIILANPRRHIDVGSRIDGFIAHLICTRKVEVFDIRPLDIEVANLTFHQFDITSTKQTFMEVSDCVSCLHTLEHIGLGRYGDVLDPNGWKVAMKALANFVAPGGCLWLSVPIGIQRIEFNAHRIFSPTTVVNEAAILGLKLNRFFYLAQSGFRESFDHIHDFSTLSEQDYCLAIFLFIK
jgi:hypothetical protein